MLWDRDAAARPLIGLSTPVSLPASLGVPLRIVVPENGPPTTMNFTIKATDPDGLGGVELVEASGARPAAVDLRRRRRPAAGPRACGARRRRRSRARRVKTYESGPIEVPYSLGRSGGERLFFFRVFDRAGNSRLSPKVLCSREIDGITIDSFVLGTEIVLGGLVRGLMFKVKGAAAASIDHGVGSDRSSNTLEYSSERIPSRRRRCRAAPTR